MNNTVLLSTSLHPVSRQFSCNHKELAAWQLAQQVDKNPTAVHVGTIDAMKPYLGFGITDIKILDSTKVDASLLDFFTQNPQDIIFTSSRAQGGLDTGMLPYLLSKYLNMGLISSVLSIDKIGIELHITQDLGRGKRRQVIVATPVVIVVADSLKHSLTYSHANSLQGRTTKIKSQNKNDIVMLCENNIFKKKASSYGKISIKSKLSGHRRLQNIIQTKSVDGEIMQTESVEQKAKAFIAYLKTNEIGL